MGWLCEGLEVGQGRGWSPGRGWWPGRGWDIEKVGLVEVLCGSKPASLMLARSLGRVMRRGLLGRNGSWKGLGQMGFWTNGLGLIGQKNKIKIKLNPNT